MRGIDGVSGAKDGGQCLADGDPCDRVDKHTITASAAGYTYTTADGCIYAYTDGCIYAYTDGYIHAYALTTHLNAHSGAANSHAHLTGAAPHRVAGAARRGAVL